MSRAERISIAEHMIRSCRTNIRTWLYVAHTDLRNRPLALRAAAQQRTYLLSWYEDLRRLHAEGGEA